MARLCLRGLLLKGLSLGFLDRDGFLSLLGNFVSEAENSTMIFNGTIAECGLDDANVTFEVSEYTSLFTISIPYPSIVFTCHAEETWSYAKHDLL